MIRKTPKKSKTVEQNSTNMTEKPGSPRYSSKVAAFQYAMKFLENNDDETITLHDLHQGMIRESGMTEEEVYSPN